MKPMKHRRQKVCTAVFVTVGLVILQYATQAQVSASPSYEQSLLMTKRPLLFLAAGNTTVGR